MVRKLIGVAALLVILAAVSVNADTLRADTPPDGAAFVDAVERYTTRPDDAASRHQRAAALCARLGT